MTFIWNFQTVGGLEHSGLTANRKPTQARVRGKVGKVKAGKVSILEKPLIITSNSAFFFKGVKFNDY